MDTPNIDRPLDATHPSNAPAVPLANDPAAPADVSRAWTKDETVNRLRAIENRVAPSTSDIPDLARIIRQFVMGDTRLDRDVPADVIEQKGVGARPKS